MEKYIIGYPAGKEVGKSNLVQYATAKEADFNTEEWVEITAHSLDEAKDMFEVKFAEWQQNSKIITQ